MSCDGHETIPGRSGNLHRPAIYVIGRSCGVACGSLPLADPDDAASRRGGLGDPDPQHPVVQ